MRVQIEVGNGVGSRFKLIDADTQQKIGLVQSVELFVNINESILRFEVAKVEHNGSSWATDLSTKLTPWLQGFLDEEGAFVFEDIDAKGRLTYADWLLKDEND